MCRCGPAVRCSCSAERPRWGIRWFQSGFSSWLRQRRNRSADGSAGRAPEEDQLEKMDIRRKGARGSRRQAEGRGGPRGRTARQWHSSCVDTQSCGTRPARRGRYNETSPRQAASPEPKLNAHRRLLLRRRPYARSIPRCSRSEGPSGRLRYHLAHSSHAHRRDRHEDRKYAVTSFRAKVIRRIRPARRLELAARFLMSARRKTTSRISSS